MKVVNVKEYGGVDKAQVAGVRYCGRPSPLGNPCSVPGKPCPICNEIHFGKGMAELTPCRSIPCFKKYLWKCISDNDREVLDELKLLKEGDLLGCWCTPKACHCDVLTKAWQWCKEKGVI